MLTARDLADLHEVHVKTIYKWGRSGVLPAPIRVGRTLRWREDDIAKFHEHLAARAADRAAGLDPDRPDGPAPPVYSSGIPTIDGREIKARRREAARESKRGAAKPVEAEQEA